MNDDQWSMADVCVMLQVLCFVFYIDHHNIGAIPQVEPVLRQRAHSLGQSEVSHYNDLSPGHRMNLCLERQLDFQKINEGGRFDLISKCVIN